MVETKYTFDAESDPVKCTIDQFEITPRTNSLVKTEVGLSNCCENRDKDNVNDPLREACKHYDHVTK